MDGNGVTVTIREIYESVNKLTKEVTDLSSSFERLEQKISEQSQLSYETKERSHKAWNKANEASRQALEANKDAENALTKIEELEKKRYEDKLSENQRQKENRTQFYISIASAIIPWLITIILGVIYFAKSGGF